MDQFQHPDHSFKGELTIAQVLEMVAPQRGVASVPALHRDWNGMSSFAPSWRKVDLCLDRECDDGEEEERPPEESCRYVVRLHGGGLVVI